MWVKLTEKGLRIAETLEFPEHIRNILEDMFGPEIKTLTVPEPEIHSRGQIYRSNDLVKIFSGC